MGDNITKEGQEKKDFLLEDTSSFEFVCKLYGKPITKYDCDELQVGVKYGLLLNDGIPHLMKIEEINEKREACLNCPKHSAEYK